MSFTAIENKVLMTAVAMTADRTSLTVDAKTIVAFTIAAVVSAGAAPVGDIVLQIQTASGGTFHPHTTTGITANGTTIFEILDPSGLFYRIFYDFTSGNGTLDVEISARIFKRGGDPADEAL